MMLDGIFMLLSLSVVMALASFFAGALPLSMSLSSSQLKTISSLGMGLLVGTSLVVIIPEGIETIYSAGPFKEDLLLKRNLLPVENVEYQFTECGGLLQPKNIIILSGQSKIEETQYATLPLTMAADDSSVKLSGSKEFELRKTEKRSKSSHKNQVTHPDLPTFYIGLSLVLGFITMFLIDKLSRRACENFQSSPPTRHISLSNLSLSSTSMETIPESESFFNTLTITPKQTRSLTTTTGLVIHAVADGIAIGASTSNSSSRLGLIIFIAMMLHKAPAAFGLTSVLLKQGLTKRAVRGHLIIFSLTTPAGALTTWLLIAIIGGSHIEEERGRWWAGMLLLLSAGTFLYVSMHAILEDSSQNYLHTNTNGAIESGISNSPRKAPKAQMRDTLAAIGGMLIPLLSQLDRHH